MNWRNGWPCCDSRGAAVVGAGDDAAGAEVGMAARGTAAQVPQKPERHATT